MSEPRSGVAGGIHLRTQKSTVTGLGWHRRRDGQGMVPGGTVQCGDSPGGTALRGVAKAGGQEEACEPPGTSSVPGTTVKHGKRNK